jgi:hypothetical protein
MSMRVVQLQDGTVRRVGLVDEPRVHLVDAESVYALAQEAIATETPLSTIVERRATGDALDYDRLYAGELPWRLLPAIDHPVEPSRCLVSGTGLTHIGSARDRNAMHESSSSTTGGASGKSATGATTSASAAAVATATPAAAPTDSLRMFEAGLAGGRPAPGRIGVAPEWFYKGTGTMLRAHREALTVPAFAEDGGEEAEIAGLYLIDPDGRPRRVGMAAGNEFSDHRFERHNYLNLAGSKLRACALGPELVLDPQFGDVKGEVWIERDGVRIWWKRIASGDAEMSHSLQNIEHHHFKFEGHRRPGDVHVHFFGAHSLSFGEGVTLADGDIMAIRFDGFGRALRNVLRIEPGPDRLVPVLAI